jgi:hypothetical protein
VLAAVWAFAVSWRTRNIRILALSVAFAAVGVLMKESTLPLPFTLPFVALATELTPRVWNEGALLMSLRNWRSLLLRAVLWSLPLAIPAALFIGLRLVAAGRVGGYRDAPTDLQHFFWDALVVSILGMVNPLNRQVFDRTFVQVVGFIVSGALFVGVVAWGRRRWPLLLMAAVWWFIFLLPALNLLDLSSIQSSKNFGNRIYYLSMIGFSIAVAAVLSGFLHLSRAQRTAAGAALGFALLACVPITWIQLQPWHQTSVQTRYLVEQTGKLTVPIGPRSVTWYTNHLPTEYRGAYVFWNGFDTAMFVFNNQLSQVRQVSDLREVDLTTPFTNTIGAYNVDFAFNEADDLFHIAYLQGLTAPVEPPSGPGRVWDFRNCSGDTATRLPVINATAACGPEYLAFRPTGDDAAIILPNMDLDLTGSDWLRIAVSVRYPDRTDGAQGQLYWNADEQSTLSEDRSRTFLLDTTREHRVYWTYLPTAAVGEHLTTLRFDPANVKTNAQISWIAVNPIPR